MDFSDLGKFLLLTGLVLTVVGLVIFLGGRFPFFGRLPGDIYFSRGTFSFHFPVVTCIIVSVVLTVIFNIFLKK